MPVKTFYKQCTYVDCGRKFQKNKHVFYTLIKFLYFFSGCLENHWFTMDSRSRITINEFELVVDEKFCLERKYWEFTYSSIKSDSIIDQNMWTSTVYKKFFKRWFGIDPIFDKFDDVVGHEHDFRIITIGNSWNYYFKTRILDWKIGVSINQVQGVSLQIVHFKWIGSHKIYVQL